MRKRFLLFVCIFGFSLNMNAEINSKIEFEKANELYKKKEYASAIKGYEKLIKLNIISPEIYFNLGNSYYKNNQNAKAIINYERALRLDPNDEDIAMNLKIANAKSVDKIIAVPELFYKKSIREIAAIFQLFTWVLIIIFTTFIAFIFFGFNRISSQVKQKKLYFFGGVIFILISLTSYLFAKTNNDLLNGKEESIIMDGSTYIKSSPEQNSTDLFILHEGTKVEILDEYDNWVKVKIANGNQGWTQLKVMEVI